MSRNHVRHSNCRPVRLKGPNKSAWGNAPGMENIGTQSPEGATQAIEKTVPPFQGSVSLSIRFLGRCPRLICYGPSGQAPAVPNDRRLTSSARRIRSANDNNPVQTSEHSHSVISFRELAAGRRPVVSSGLRQAVLPLIDCNPAGFCDTFQL